MAGIAIVAVALASLLVGVFVRTYLPNLRNAFIVAMLCVPIGFAVWGAPFMARALIRDAVERGVLDTSYRNEIDIGVGMVRVSTILTMAVAISVAVLAWRRKGSAG